ncbi:hypothetical protein C7S15_1689 [Burkholderia cepacia]|nr:hypothetical protein [Burkholderia cepacia]
MRSVPASLLRKKPYPDEIILISFQQCSVQRNRQAARANEWGAFCEGFL